MSYRVAFNALAICGAAAFIGAMLIIGLTLGAYWKSLPPAAFIDWFSAYSHLIARTIPLFAIPTVAGLVVSLTLSWSVPAERRLWLLATICMAGLAAITMLYHLPTNASFVAKTVPPADVAGVLDRWLWLHWGRIALAATSVLFGIAAVVEHARQEARGQAR